MSKQSKATQQGFPLDTGRKPTPTRARKPWGHESDFTKALRERQLDAVIYTGCDLCGTGVTRTVRDGRVWFQKHEQTKTHQGNLKRRKK